MAAVRANTDICTLLCKRLRTSCVVLPANVMTGHREVNAKVSFSLLSPGVTVDRGHSWFLRDICELIRCLTSLIRKE